MSVAMQNHRRLSIFCCVLKPEAVVGAFQNKKSGIFSFKWMNQDWAQRYL